MHHPTSIIHPSARLGKNVRVGAYSVIEENTVIGDDTEILERATIGRNTILGRGNIIHAGAVIGDDPQTRSAPRGLASRLEIGDRNVFREYATVHRGSMDGSSTVIGSDGYFMVSAHVGHDGLIGDRVTVGNSCLIGGYVTIESDCMISAGVGIHQFCRAGRHAMAGGNCTLTKDLPPYMLMDNDTEEVAGINLVGLRRANFSEEAKRDIKNAYKILFRSDLNTAHAVEEIERKCHSPEVACLVDFIKQSKRGILPHRKVSWHG